LFIETQYECRYSSREGTGTDVTATHFDGDPSTYRHTVRNYRKIFLFPARKSPAITEKTPTSTPDGVVCEGVPAGIGTVSSTVVRGKGLVVGLVVAIVERKVVVGIVGGEDVVVGIVGSRTGSPLSMKTDAEDWGFSALMENVRVAVPDDVWKATTARPSRSVVTRA